MAASMGPVEEFQVTLRPDALARLAEAAPEAVTRRGRTKGTPSRSALIGRSGAQVTELFKDGRPPGNRAIGRILKLHAQRRGISHGQAFDELFIVTGSVAVGRERVA